MGRIFRGNDGGGAIMSEQEDIDSDFMPHSEHTIQSEEEMVSDDEGAYYSSQRQTKGAATHDTHVYDRTKDDDNDIDSESDSFSESEEEYYSSSEFEEDEPPVEKDGDSDTSPTGVSDVDGANGAVPVQAQKTKEKKKGFLGKLFGGKSFKMNKKKAAQRNSDLSDGDIERSESASYDQSGKSYPHYDDTIKSQDPEHEGMMTNKSESTYYVGDVTEQDVPMNDTPPIPPQKPRTSIQDERRKSYERILPGVVEETSQDEISQERSHSEPLARDPEEHSYGSFVKREESERDEIEMPPEKTPDPPERQVQSKGRKGKLKGSEAPHTTKSKKKKDPIQKPASNVSALAAKNHAATSRRLDYAGQITSSTRNLTNKLEGEVHRLKTLVELMMTRMELYERQSECLVETSVEHNRQWKQAMLESQQAKKQTKMSPTDEQLSNIKNLLIERSIQDKWIRQLEGIQRGYEQRLETTQSQLRTLRYEHICTNKAIVDLKKNGGASSSSRNTETLTENSTNSTRDTDLATPVATKNIPMQRWVTEASSPAGPPVRYESPKDANALDTTAKSNRSLMDELPKAGSLLEEMIVSWHSNAADIDATDMSPLSDRGRKKIKPKKEKKKKKSKKSKHPRD